MNASGSLSGLIGLALAILVLVADWMIFTKAGRPGWWSIIPFFNAAVWFQIAGRPWWWIVLLLIPVVNIVILVMVSVDFARAFGHSAVFGILLLFFLSVIGYLILGFDSSTYRAPARA